MKALACRLLFSLQMAGADAEIGDNKHVGSQLNAECNTDTVDDDCQFMPGIQLDRVRSFTGQCGGNIHLTPIIVDFRSLLLSKTGDEIIIGVSSFDMRL